MSTSRQPQDQKGLNELPDHLLDSARATKKFDPAFLAMLGPSPWLIDYQKRVLNPGGSDPDRKRELAAEHVRKARMNTVKKSQKAKKSKDKKHEAPIRADAPDSRHGTDARTGTSSQIELGSRDTNSKAEVSS